MILPEQFGLFAGMFENLPTLSALPLKSFETVSPIFLSQRPLWADLG